MRIAFFTDIHANREAFEACLAHADNQKIDQIALLGDLVGYGADPAWVVSKVMELAERGAWVLVGNHDEAVVKPRDSGMHPLAKQVVEWTRNQLSEAQIEFLAKLPYDLYWEGILLAHANAHDPENWDYIDNSIDAMRSLQSTPCDIVVCGHVHQPALYHLSLTGKTGEFIPTPGIAIPLTRQRRWLIIPGSVGQPRDGNPAACYAVLDTLHYELVYHRVPYDVQGAGKKILDAGLPVRLAERLLTGH